MVVDFIFKSIVCRFKTPLQIITDNGTQFASKEMKLFCEDNELEPSFASIYHPKTNGQVEAMNKAIAKILIKR